MDPSSASRTRTDIPATDTTAELFAALVGASTHERSLLEEQIVEAFLPFAARFASRYRNRGVDTEDLRQVANVALLMALRRFDPSRGQFTSFAAVTISGEIKKYFRDYAWTVRPPRWIQELQMEISATTAEWLQSHGAQPTAAELAEMVDDDTARVAEARRATGCFRASSLDATVGASDRPPIEKIVDDRDDHDMTEVLADLATSCRELTDADRTLIELRFFRDMTQLEIGEVLGVTQMQVSRRLSTLMNKLRDAMDQSLAA